MLWTSWIVSMDRDLFEFIHATMAVPALDGFFLFLRNAAVWIPFYAFMIFWVIKFHRKQALSFIVLSVLTVAITDYTSASILKPVFARARPCFDPELTAVIRNLVGCGGYNSMPSSHASNHFGLATFWFWSVFLLNNRKFYVLYLWAALIGYAQIYVGKHYPLDILAGAVFGWTVGIVTAKLFERWSFKTANKYQPAI